MYLSSRYTWVEGGGKVIVTHSFFYRWNGTMTSAFSTLTGWHILTPVPYGAWWSPQLRKTRASPAPALIAVVLLNESVRMSHVVQILRSWPTLTTCATATYPVVQAVVYTAVPWAMKTHQLAKTSQMMTWMRQYQQNCSGLLRIPRPSSEIAYYSRQPIWVAQNLQFDGLERWVAVFYCYTYLLWSLHRIIGKQYYIIINLPSSVVYN